MNTFHEEPGRSHLSSDFPDITRFSGGRGQNDVGRTVDIQLLGFSNLVEFLVALSQEVRTPDQKSEREWIAPFILKPGSTRRIAENISHFVRFIAIDIDAPGWTFDRILSRMNGLEFIAHTTTKSRPDHQRWRVIAFLSREYTVTEHASVWHFMNDKFDRDIDKNTKDKTRISFAPAQWVGADNHMHQVAGALLNVDEILASHPVADVRTPQLAVTELPVLGPPPDGLEIVTQGMVTEFMASPPGGRFWKLLCSAAVRCAANGWRVSSDELCRAALLVSPTDASGERRVTPEREASRALAWAATNIQAQTPMDRIRSRSRWHLQHFKR